MINSQPCNINLFRLGRAFRMRLDECHPANTHGEPGLARPNKSGSTTSSPTRPGFPPIPL